MSTVIELMAQADKVAVDLHPLDAVHAEATRELADLEARIDGARAKAKAALDAKADLSARFESIVSDLGKAGVERSVVERMVADRIAFLIQVGALAKPASGPIAIPVVAPVSEPKPEPAKVSEPTKPIENPQAAAPVEAIVTPSVELPQAGTASPAPEPEPQPETAPVVEAVPDEVPSAAETEAVELPPLRLGGGAAVSPIPASRQRRPRIAPVMDPVAEVEPVRAEPQEPVQDSQPATVAAAPEVEEPVVEAVVPPKAYLSVVGSLDLDAEEDSEGEVGDGASEDEGDPMEEEGATQQDLEPPATVADAPAKEEPKVEEPAKAAATTPSTDEGAFIPAFLR